MNEKEIINQIESLKQIKPNQEWVSSTRADIVGVDAPVIFSSFFSKPAFVGTFSFVLLAGLLFFSQSMILEEQKMAEGEVEVSGQELAKQKEIEDLSLALAELRNAKAELDQSFSSAVAVMPQREAIDFAKSIAPQMIEMKEKEELIIQSLAVVVSEEVNESESNKKTDRGVAALLLDDFIEQSEDDEMIEELGSLFSDGKYSEVIKMLDK
ncbi:MAG: hypothetical protein PHV25_01370 [Candidatus Pacebacteria bacterium]|nr:hypothetical protein [Candidatus Paceibacterota bacterium]